jgi:hypothetical protein
LEGSGFSDWKEVRRVAKERKKQDVNKNGNPSLPPIQKQQMDAIRQRIVEVLHMCKEVCKAQKLKLKQAM